MAHYINPAFCQKSEFSARISNNANNIPQSQFLGATVSKSQFIQHEESKRDREQNQKKSIYFEISPDSEENVGYQNDTTMQFKTSRYALVPLEDLYQKREDRCVIPSAENQILRNSSLKQIRSQDNLRLILPKLVREEKDEEKEEEEGESYISLPAFTPQDIGPKLISGFSSDFINKSMFLVDRNSMQRYTIVPTDDDEEVVDANHEIIEMHNGRLHRYAVIPTDDEKETIERVMVPEIILNQTLSKKGRLTAEFQTQTKIKPFKPENTTKITEETSSENTFIQKRTNNLSHASSHHIVTTYDKPQNYMFGTPTKNPIATQKLHELLSTPYQIKQEMLQRQGSYQTILQRSPDQIQLKKRQQPELTSQKIEYEDNRTTNQNIDHRTTAIISPRLHQQAVYATLAGIEKPCPQNFQKVENATATIGAVSLMLILTGVLNSGLCLYMVTDVSMMFSKF